MPFRGYLLYISITFDPLYFSDDEISDNAEEFSEKAGECLKSWCVRVGGGML